MRWARRGSQVLDETKVGLSDSSDIPIGPRQLCRPFDGVITIIGFIDKRIELALGPETTTSILDNDHIAMLGEIVLLCQRHILAFVIGRANDEHGESPRRIGAIHVRVEGHTIPGAQWHISVYDDAI